MSEKNSGERSGGSALTFRYPILRQPPPVRRPKCSRQISSRGAQGIWPTCQFSLVRKTADARIAVAKFRDKSCSENLILANLYDRQIFQEAYQSFLFSCFFRVYSGKDRRSRVSSAACPKMHRQKSCNRAPKPRWLSYGSHLGRKQN